MACLTESPAAVQEEISASPVVDIVRKEDPPPFGDADSSSYSAGAEGGPPKYTNGTLCTNGTGEDPEKVVLTNGSASIGGEEDEKKHPLEHTWCLSVRRRGAPQADQGKRMFEFATAEDFWCMHHHAFPPSKLIDIDTSLFHKGILPVWDDPIFGTGGRWVLRVDKSQAHQLDDLWLSLSLALIGEAFYDQVGDIVAGAICSTRSRTTRIALWVSKTSDEKLVLALGHAFRDVLADTPGVSDLYSKEFVFEDFRTQAITLQLPRPGIAGLTEGIFQ